MVLFISGKRGTLVKFDAGSHILSLNKNSRYSYKSESECFRPTPLNHTEAPSSLKFVLKHCPHDIMVDTPNLESSASYSQFRSLHIVTSLPSVQIYYL